MIHKIPEPKRSFTAWTVFAMNLTFPLQSGWSPISKTSRNSQRYGFRRIISLKSWTLTTWNCRLSKRINALSDNIAVLVQTKTASDHSPFFRYTTLRKLPEAVFCYSLILLLKDRLTLLPALPHLLHLKALKSEGQACCPHLPHLLRQTLPALQYPP